MELGEREREGEVERPCGAQRQASFFYFRGAARISHAPRFRTMERNGGGPAASLLTPPKPGGVLR